jgi:hypothetical protein
VVLLPGLIAAGFGSLVFIGVGSVTRLSTEAFTLPPLSLPSYTSPRLARGPVEVVTDRARA